MRARWLAIASVKTGVYVILRNWGCPNGLYVHWIGEASTLALAPCEFLRWREILSVVDVRLRRHGLQRVDWGTAQAAERGWVLLRVRVIRIQNSECRRPSSAD